jgi:hypothetical protein
MLSHRGGGILSGDFIKPDPAMTRSETRQHLLDETERWLSGDIRLHALTIYASQLTPADVAIDVRCGLWPAARLFTLLTMLRDAEAIPDIDIDKQISITAAWAASTIRQRMITDDSPVLLPMEEYAMGFWQTDRLPNGRTIASYWDESPFEALRSAGPLSDPVSIDEKIEASVLSMQAFLMEDHTFTMPGWALLAAVSVCVWYMACVAAALSMKCRW